MSKRLECVVDGCDATIEAESEDEVMSQAQSHVAKEHPDMDLDADTIADVRASIQDV
jgi:predicted small metal-binding protein